MGSKLVRLVGLGLIMLSCSVWAGCSMVGMVSDIESYDGRYVYNYLGETSTLCETVVQVGKEQGYHLAGRDQGLVKFTTQIPMLGSMLVGAHSDTTVICRVHEDRYFSIHALLMGNFGSAGKEPSDALAKRLLDGLSNKGYMFSSLNSSPGETLAFLNVGLAQNPEDATICNNLAWFLATTEEAQFRNGARALELSRKAVQMRHNIRMLDTLAAAYAETGNFPEAIRAQEEVLKLASHDNKQFQEYQNHMVAYRAGRPWRQPRVSY